MENSLQTLGITLVGFAVAVVLGVVLGVAIGTSRLVYRGLYPVLVGFNSIARRWRWCRFSSSGSAPA